MRYVASCPICLDSSDDDTWVALDCGHLFHQTCAMQTVEYKNACPSCRNKTTIKGTRTVFLSLDELSPSAAHAHGEDRSEELKRLGDLFRASQKQLHEQSQRIELLEKKNNELNSENKQLKQLLKEGKQQVLRTEKSLQEEKSHLESKIKKLKEQMESKENVARSKVSELEKEKGLLAQKVQRLNVMKRISDIGTGSDPDVQEFLQACGDNKEDLTEALKRVYGEFKKVKDGSVAMEKKCADLEASHLAELTKTTRDLKQRIDVAQMESRKRGLKINELEAKLMDEHQFNNMDGEMDEDLVVLDSEEEPVVAPPLPPAVSGSLPKPNKSFPQTSKPPPSSDYRNGVPGGGFVTQQGIGSSMTSGSGGFRGGPSFIGRSVGGNLSSFASSGWDTGAKPLTSFHQNSSFLAVGAGKRPAEVIDQPKIDSFFIKAGSATGSRQRTT